MKHGSFFLPCIWWLSAKAQTTGSVEWSYWVLMAIHVFLWFSLPGSHLLQHLLSLRYCCWVQVGLERALWKTKHKPLWPIWLCQGLKQLLAGDSKFKQNVIHSFVYSPYKKKTHGEKIWLKRWFMSGHVKNDTCERLSREMWGENGLFPSHIKSGLQDMWTTDFTCLFSYVNISAERVKTATSHVNMLIFHVCCL